MRRAFLPVIFAFFLAAQAVLAASAFHLQAQWSNVPPAPGKSGASVMALGDTQMAYRTISIMLQNLGNVGGRTEKFENYDYSRLGEWFGLADSLDPRANYMPLLAAFYFSNTKNLRDLDPVIDYLAHAGEYAAPEKWRWLAQAVYLARFRQEDSAKALRLANELAAQWHEGRPLWMKQMPAFVMTDAGDREAAYDMMIGMLKQDSANMSPQEIGFMVDYICHRILTPDEAMKNPVCAN